LKEELIGAEQVDFFVFSRKYAQGLESGNQFGTLLKEYELFLRQDCKNHSNTIFKDYAMIRKILNDAIDEGLLSRDNNPFHRYRIKLQPTQRDYLLEEELQAIEMLNLEGRPPVFHARNIFIFACYTGGIRISDLLQLRWKDITDGRVSVRTKKTGALQVVKLTHKALEILDLYRKDRKFHPFIFPYFISEDDLMSSSIPL